MKPLFLISLVAFGAAGCARISDVGQAPALSPVVQSAEHAAMAAPQPVDILAQRDPLRAASLWSGDRKSLLGDWRAGQRGDIMTVVVEIDDRAEIDNATNRSRSGSESMQIPELLGIPATDRREPPRRRKPCECRRHIFVECVQRVGRRSTHKKERLTVRIAATVVDVQPNGVLRIEGRQESTCELRTARDAGDGIRSSAGYLPSERDHLRQDRGRANFLWRTWTDHRRSTTPIWTAGRRYPAAVLTMGKILAVLLVLVLGAGGAGAGYFLRPPPPEMEADAEPQVLDLPQAEAVASFRDGFIVPVLREGAGLESYHHDARRGPPTPRPPRRFWGSSRSCGTA